MLIPHVDLRDFTGGSAQTRAQFVKTVGESLRDIGFFILKGHGVSKVMIDQSYEVCREFFSLPASSKARYDLPDLHGQRGFTSFGKEHAKDQSAPDLKEFWHIGRDPDGAVGGSGPGAGEGYLGNIWPSETPAFQSTFLDLFRRLDECSLLLLDACSEHLGQKPTFLRDMAVGGNSILRIIHYPPLPATRDPHSVRAAAHEDINFITLLPESTASGLELLDRDGRWQPVKADPGEIIVDSGDMLQNLTNGYFRSTTHRVVNPEDGGKPRYSMPFFVHPRSEVDLTPMVSLSKSGAKFPSITAGSFLRQRLAEIGLAAKT